MRPILLKTLKILALQGGTRHSVHISSTELAKKLDISQQSASRHIIYLEKKGDPFVVELKGDSDIKIGDVVKVGFDSNKCHLFDISGKAYN